MSECLCPFCGDNCYTPKQRDQHIQAKNAWCRRKKIPLSHSFYSNSGPTEALVKVSKQVYWGVVRNRKGGRMWPMTFHFRYGDAKDEAWRYNGKIPKRFLKNPEYVVERYLLETTDKTHYDIYKHETKRI